MKQNRPSKLGVAWTAGRLAGRRLFRREPGAKDVALGHALADQLDQMKGLAMKVGQIVSYMDVPLPETVQAELARLQVGQHGMAAADTRAVIEAALGARVEELFDELDFAPVAAASIGQVHRARYRGAPVAVKVQYPQVAGSFASDLSTIGRFASLASLASAVDGRAVVAELAARLEEECDYDRERRMQDRFAAAFVDDAAVHIPHTIAKRSARTVLTSEWIEGESFDEVRRVESSRRDAIAHVLVRFTYRGLLELAAIQADPHPGNFLFREDETVTFLDFGCVRELDQALVEALREMSAALRADDLPRFRDAVTAMGLVGKPRKFDFDHFYQVMRHLYRPLLVPRFEFDGDYVREGFALNGPRSPNARTMAMPPAYIWIARLQWGLWSILARLRAQGSFGDLLDELLARPIRPLLASDDQPSTARVPHSSAGAR